MEKEASGSGGPCIGLCEMHPHIWAVSGSQERRAPGSHAGQLGDRRECPHLWRLREAASLCFLPEVLLGESDAGNGLAALGVQGA